MTLTTEQIKKAARTVKRKVPSKHPERIKHKEPPHVLTVRVKPQVYRKLQRLAKRNGMTQVATLSALIELGYQSSKGEK